MTPAQANAPTVQASLATIHQHLKSAAFSLSIANSQLAQFTPQPPFNPGQAVSAAHQLLTTLQAAQQQADQANAKLAAILIAWASALPSRPSLDS